MRTDFLHYNRNL